MYTLDAYHFVFIGALWKIKYKLIGTADYPKLVDKLLLWKPYHDAVHPMQSWHYFFSGTSPIGLPAWKFH